jgi:hypothetical protein
MLVHHQCQQQLRCIAGVVDTGEGYITGIINTSKTTIFLGLLLTGINNMVRNASALTLIPLECVLMPVILY